MLRRQGLELCGDSGHEWFSFDVTDVRVESAQLRCVEVELLGELRAPCGEHLVQGVAVDVAVHYPRHLIEPEPEVLERQDAAKHSELPTLVGAISAVGIHSGRGEQADLVVVPEHPDGHPAYRRELSDAEHDVSEDSASHCVRVNSSILEQAGPAEEVEDR